MSIWNDFICKIKKFLWQVTIWSRIPEPLPMFFYFDWYHRNINNKKHQLRLLMPAYRISLGFSRWKPAKLAIFVWIFSCGGYHGNIKTKVFKIANGTTWYRDISRLPLKPTQSFKPRHVRKKNFFFVFPWIWPEPMRGRQREKILKETSLKAKTNFSASSAAIFFIFKIVSSTL